MALVPARKRKESRNLRNASRDGSKRRLIDSRQSSLGVSEKPAQKLATNSAGQTLSNIRKRGVKILSIFRPGKSESSCNLRRILLTTYLGPVLNPEVAPTGNGGSGTGTSDSTQAQAAPLNSRTLQCPSVPNIPMSLPPLGLERRSSSLLQLTNAAVFDGVDGESEPIISTRTPPSPDLYIRRSTSALSRQLTSKISNTLFHNETVIHRPKLSSRPSISTTYFEETPPSQFGGSSPEAHMSDVPSLPSQTQSAPGSSNPPLSLSTAPTSLFSSGAPLSAEAAHRGHNESGNGQAAGSTIYEPLPEQTTSRWLVFPRQDAPVVCRPSVTTIENAAAAKVFFESHFNQLLTTRATARSIRRRNIERKLFAMSIPNEQRQQQRKAWYMGESYHLRQTRVLKSKTLIRQSIKGVHVSNYDIVRVLGKGSFGVVRLVREKSEHHGDSGSSDGYRIENVDGASVHGIVPSSPPNQKAKQVFAMKVIRKSDMLRNSQEGHLRAERDFLVASENSRWVVPLMAAFQDNNNLYLVMEYMVGGDFLGLLLREDILDETVAK